MTIETTVNKHRGALLIAIGGFLVFLYIRHKRQQAAAAAAAQAAADAAAAASQDPGTMDQNTYDKQFSQPAPAYLGSPFSGYGANAPNFPPPTQLQPGAGPTTPTPPISFPAPPGSTVPNPAASSGDSTVAAATGGGAPTSGGTGMGFPLTPTPVTPPSNTPLPPNAPPELASGMAYAQSKSSYQAPIDPSGHPSVLGQGYWVPQGSTIGAVTGYVNPQVGTGLYTGAAGEPGTPTYQGVGWVPPAYR